MVRVQTQMAAGVEHTNHYSIVPLEGVSLMFWIVKDVKLHINYVNYRL